MHLDPSRRATRDLCTLIENVYHQYYLKARLTISSLWGLGLGLAEGSEPDISVQNVTDSNPDAYLAFAFLFI